MKSLLTLSLILSVWSCSNSNSNTTKPYPNHVGDIEFNPELDSKEFSPCSEQHINQYYNFGSNIQYKGEKRALLNTFKEKYVTKIRNVDGYITIRFVVNCLGETGRFRVKTLDQDYKPTTLDKETVDQILDITKSLDGWKAGEYEGAYFDYYQYLTFKLSAGQIESIIP